MCGLPWHAMETAGMLAGAAQEPLGSPHQHLMQWYQHLIQKADVSHGSTGTGRPAHVLLGLTTSCSPQPQAPW